MPCSIPALLLWYVFFIIFAEWVLDLTKSSRQKKQSFVYGSTVLMASMIIVKLLGAVFKIPLTNVLGETGMGYFGSAYNVYTAVYALTVTGLSAAVARMVAENSTQGRYRDVKKIFRLSTLMFLVLGLLGFVIIVCSAGGFSRLIDSPNSYWSVMMIAPAIFFCCLMASYRGYFEGLSNMTPTAVTQVAEVTGKLIAGLGFSFLIMGAAQKQYQETGLVFGIVCDSMEAANMAAVPYGAAGAMLGVSVSTLIGFLFIFLRYKIKGDAISREMLAGSPSPDRAKSILRRLIKIAVPITLGAIVLQLSALIDTVTIQNRLTYCYRTDPSVLNAMYGQYLKDNEEMHTFLYGCFTTCVTLFNLVPAFTSIFGKSALPNVTSAWTESDRRKIKLNLESVIRVTMLVAAPMAIGLAFMAGPVLTLLYSRLPGIISVGAPMLSILAVASLFLALVAPVNAIMQGIGRVDLPVKYLFAGALVKLVLNVVLVGIPSLNIIGSAVSTLACYLLIAILSIGKLRSIVPVKLDFSGIFLKPVISGLVCGGTAFISWRFLSAWRQNSLVTIVSIAVGGIFYIISLAVLNTISKDDILMLPNGKNIAKTLEKWRLIR